MAREIPCAICKIDDNKYTLVELHNEKAVAALCEEHKKDKDNFDRIQNRIPPHQLQNVLNQYMEDTIINNNQSLLDRLNDLESNNLNMKEEIKSLRAQIKSQDKNTEAIIKETVKDIKPKPAKSKSKVNEYGELI
jgi:multidrug resistance efflux pump